MGGFKSFIRLSSQCCGGGVGGKRLPWAVLGGREPDTLESQSLVSTGESQTRNI